MSRFESNAEPGYDCERQRNVHNLSVFDTSIFELSGVKMVFDKLLRFWSSAVSHMVSGVPPRDGLKSPEKSGGKHGELKGRRNCNCAVKQDVAGGEGR